MSNFNQTLEEVLKKHRDFIDNEGDLYKAKVIDSAWKVEPKLIELLLENQQIKDKFFSEIKGHWVFNVALFVAYIQDKNFLIDSWTKYKNKIGLMDGNKFLNQKNDVALVWPFKDCVLEGGQSTEETGRKEIFFNEILAQDEIDVLLDPKVLTGFKRYGNTPKIKDFDPLKGVQEEVFFNRDKDGTIKDNLIIKGNNLLALHSLKKQFAGKVKLIYIDPPYNTGNDGFKYNDNFNHSTWLTFMKNRLEVARELLRDDGVIFVQCDDNEQAYLKVLMDEIFGRENFTGCLIWKKSSGKNDSRFMATLTEYSISYRKTDKLDKFNYKVSEAVHNLEDEKGKFKIEKLDRGGLEYRKNNDFIIKAPDGTNIYPGNNEKEYIERKKGNHQPRDWQWRLSEKRFNIELENNKIFFKKVGNNWSVYTKKYEDEKSYSPYQNLVDFTNNSEANKEIINIFGNKAFTFPKPEKLLQRIIEMSTNPGDIVLDYHLGSGTTCAVAHKMGRQYIGIEQMDYIETIAVERLKKVIGKGEVRKISDEEKAGLQGVLEKLENKNNTLI